MRTRGPGRMRPRTHPGRGGHGWGESGGGAAAGRNGSIRDRGGDRERVGG